MLPWAEPHILQNLQLRSDDGLSHHPFLIVLFHPEARLWHLLLLQARKVPVDRSHTSRTVRSWLRKMAPHGHQFEIDQHFFPTQQLPPPLRDQ